MTPNAAGLMVIGMIDMIIITSIITDMNKIVRFFLGLVREVINVILDRVKTK